MMKRDVSMMDLGHLEKVEGQKGGRKLEGFTDGKGSSSKNHVEDFMAVHSPCFDPFLGKLWPIGQEDLNNT